MTTPDLRQLADEIRKAAADNEMRPAEVSRAWFKKHTGRKDRLVDHHWGAAKALACDDALPTPAVPRGHSVKGVSTLVDKDGRTLAQWVKTRELHEDPAAVMEQLVKSLDDLVSPRPLPTAAPTADLPEDMLAVYPLGDMHLGMYAAAREAGRDWNTAKAVAIAKAAIDRLVLYGEPAGKALLINLGDFFHADSQSNRTPRSGHQLDVDGRYFEIMEEGLALKVYMIDRLLQHHEHVEVWVNKGNHDWQSALCLGISLAAYYRNEPRVTISKDPSAATYLEHGRCLIASTHGDTYKASKPDDMIATMAHDQPLAWGRTRHRYWYVGHVHHASLKEGKGARVETFQTLASADAWHSREGYRADRSMCRIALHRKRGEVSRYTLNAEDLET